MRHILRDISFALTPISLIFIGFWLAGKRPMWPLILKVIVILGIITAIVHLSIFVQNPNLLSVESMVVRKETSGSGDLVVLAFVLVLFQKHYKIDKLFPKILPRIIVIPVLLASIVLSYSRTELIIFVILSLSLMGWVSRLNSRMLLAIGVVMIGFITIAIVTPKDERGTYRSKIVRSVEEITISDYKSMLDKSRNWRGYETYKAVETYLAGDSIQLIVGQGFGALVDLGFYMPLGGDGDTSYREIPVTHNGYVYILVKTGLIGLICYCIFYITVMQL